MTLPAEIPKVTYDGDGSTRDWDITFSIVAPDGSDIHLYKTDVNGVITEITANYSIDVANKKATYPTVASGLPLLTSDEKITLLRLEPLSQETDWQNQGPFNAETVEATLDKLTAITQQLDEAISRCIKYPLTDAEAADVAEAVAEVVAEIAQAMLSLTRGTFNNDNLVDGKLTITHNKALSAPYVLLVMIYDNNGKVIIPDEITGSANSHEVDLSSFGTLTGTWGYIYL